MTLMNPELFRADRSYRFDPTGHSNRSDDRLDVAVPQRNDRGLRQTGIYEPTVEVPDDLRDIGRTFHRRGSFEIAAHDATVTVVVLHRMVQRQATPKNVRGSHALVKPVEERVDAESMVTSVVPAVIAFVLAAALLVAGVLFWVPGTGELAISLIFASVVATVVAVSHLYVRLRVLKPRG
jgi:hypothetical protein